MSEFTLSKIVEALSEPFPAAYVEWKPQQVSKDGGKALAAAYVDARRYQERLDLVCPDWSSRIELMAEGRVAKVSLTIAGITREDVGEADGNDPNTVTTAVAQAFKRACAAFGLGRYLYFLPMTWVDYDSQKRKLLNTPTLPDWALSPADRLEKSTRSAVQREAAEKGLQGESQPPQPPPAPVADDEAIAPGEAVIHFGKMSGKTIADVWASGPVGQGWLRWCANTDGKGFDPKGRPENVRLQRMARAFLALNAAYAG